MKPKRLNGYWTKKDGTEYVFIEKVYKAGHVTGIRYFKKGDIEVVDINTFKISHEDLEREYDKGMK